MTFARKSGSISARRRMGAEETLEAPHDHAREQRRRLYPLGGIEVSKISGIFATAAAAAITLALTSAPSYADGPIVGLVTKTNTNPFFVKMKEGFEAKAKELGLTPAGLRRQVRRRQRRRSRGDRAADRRRRQGHPAGAERFDRDRADGEEGARRRRHRHHARYAARSADRRRRAFRHRQLQGRPADRRVGEGNARRQGQDRQDRHARPRRQRADRRLSASQRLPRRLRHHGEGSRSTSP